MIAKQTKRLLLLSSLAAFALASFGAGMASAAVSLGVGPIAHGFTISTEPVHRGDEWFKYDVTVRNTGDAPTTAPTSLNLKLPSGVLLDGVLPSSSTGWSCLLIANTCIYSGAAVNGGQDFPTLSVGVLLDPVLVPDTLTATFTAFGGGASASAIGQHSFALGSPLSFGLLPGDAGFVAGACGAAPASSPPTTGACESAEAGDAYLQAGGHPYLGNTAFFVTRKKARPNPIPGPRQEELPVESLRDGVVNLPAGFVANPQAMTGGCTVDQVSTVSCPARFAIGRAEADIGETRTSENLTKETTVFKSAPAPGYPARFAFKPVPASGVTIVLKPKIRPGDLTISALIPTAPQLPVLYGVYYFSFCSFGADARLVSTVGGPASLSSHCRQPTDPGALSIPFFTNPTRCNGAEDVSSIDVTSYRHPGRYDEDGLPDLSDPNWKSYESKSPPLAGCNQLPFDPSFVGRPTTNLADSPSGLNFDLRVPQSGLLDPDGLATAHLKRTTVAFPEGMVVNPSSATGLEACSEEQMGLVTTSHPGPFPIQFDGRPVQCPDGSRLGSVEITSPLINETVTGGVYLAKQYDNPYDSLLAVYIAVRNDEIGVSAKLAGEVEADPDTGRLTATFDQNPQLPFDHLSLKLPEGPRASLRTPATCGVKTTAASFASWSEQTPVAERTDSFATEAAPGGGPCASDPSGLPNSPSLAAGTVNPRAGAYSPFVLRLARRDGEQELKGIEATLPPGLTGRLAGVPYCPEAGIAAARAREVPGQGAAEQASPSCPADSQLGSVEVSAGAGPTPYRTSGKAYLAGPYKGAPVSMVVIAPAVAGPFDLGTVVVRSALYINPVSTQVSVKSDPIPTILKGIPLDVRSVEVSITRNQFTLNPTNCEPMSVGATALGLSSNAGLSNPFQANECAALGFKPGLKLQLHGSPKRAKYQQLTATVTYPKGAYANIARASVALPHSAFLAQEHIGTVCTRVQFAADQCPAASVYGSAEATTPLLDGPLKGPVYLRSSNNPLPDLVVALKGPDSQPIEVELAGRTDSVHGGIRNTFDFVPDAPVSKFTLRLLGGKKSLLVNSRNLCGGAQRATARFTAQNGREYHFRPIVGNDCKKKKGSKGKKTAKGKGKHERFAHTLAHVLRAW